MNRTRWINLGVELAASALTLAGIYAGSTTLPGAMCYAGGLVFWFALTVRSKVWGLMPLNIASTIVTALNVWQALQ